MNKLYVRLAKTNIGQNKQFYLPYILTGILNVAMFYIMVSMSKNSGLDRINGGADLKMILGLGVYVIAIFAFIFLFYTNSFIIKRRKKEIGIYNILGMEKRHISKMMFLETLFVMAVAIVGGLLFGIVFSKLLMMLLYHLLKFSETIVFSISVDGIVRSCILFLAIYLAAYAYNLLQIKLAKPVELLSGSSVGEREPKTKGFLAVSGILCIGAGYYIAITTKNPVEALMLFFVAVVLVIVGTYCLFTAGSIAFLKLLRKNKNFYYKSNHFTAVSGMLYRMKQNAVGLSNICILSTMVLVMVSGTVCLYFGTEDAVKTRHPAEIVASADYFSVAEDFDPEILNGQVREQVKACGRTITSFEDACSCTFLTEKKDGAFCFGDARTYFGESSCLFDVMMREDFLSLNDEVEVGEIPAGAVVLVGKSNYEGEFISIGDKTYEVADVVSYLPDEDEIYVDMIGEAYYVLTDETETMMELFTVQKEAYGENASAFSHDIYVNIDGTEEEKIACGNAVAQETFLARVGDGWESFSVEGRAESRASFYALYGGLFFLGIFLGVLFLMVTVLIIFYKQISEGYEDKERFAIMQKVGMSKKEVKATIRTQVRLVFFLPLIVAAIHVWAAFPIICRLISMLYLVNEALFAGCVVGTILIFAVIYYFVFKMTSKTYDKIVDER